MGSTKQLILELFGPEDTRSLGRKIGRLLQGGEVLALIGDLGAGKTTFVQGLAAGMGLSPENVSSPTFVIVTNLIGNRIGLNHVDLYRLDLDEAVELGLEEIMTGPDSENQVTAIEWADRARELLPDDVLEILFTWEGPGRRKASLLAKGPVSETILAELRPSEAAGNEKTEEAAG